MFCRSERTPSSAPSSKTRQRSDYFMGEVVVVASTPIQTAKRPHPRAAARVGLLVFSPDFEGRRNAERRALVVSAAAYFPDCRETEATETPLSVPSQRFLSLGPNFRAQARASSPSRQVTPPFTCPVQPLKAAPRSGHGRLPKASRVRACEARPQAPHRPSGCPSGQLSLCPTSVTPLEAPPRRTGQD
jgi:hypothetical protein